MLFKRYGIIQVLSGILASMPLLAEPECTGVQLGLDDSFGWLVARTSYTSTLNVAETGSAFVWTRNGTNLLTDTVTATLHLPFDGTIVGSGLETPVQTRGLSYSSGRWGQALSLDSTGRLSYARSTNYDPNEGTIEFRVALRENGNSPAYTNKAAILFHYIATNGDYTVVAISPSSGNLYAGGSISGEWESAYSDLASTRGWTSNRWHHCAFTYSAALSEMRLYIDGALCAFNNEGHYFPPPANGQEIYVGSTPWSYPTASVLLDEFMIHDTPLKAPEIAARANRSLQPAPYESWYATNGLVPGDTLTAAFTPVNANHSTGTTQTASLIIPIIPITSVWPESMVLPVGATGITLTVITPANTQVRYSVDTPEFYSDMAGNFTPDAGGTQHVAYISWLPAGANLTHTVFLRCASETGYVQQVQFRALPAVNPRFPRIGNLWGWWQLADRTAAEKARISLWLGADEILPTEAAEVRALNPNLLILCSINAVENGGLTEDYYLKDVNGNKVEVWPGSYRLNMTKPYVAEYQARFAADKIRANNLMFDGCFFDNVMLTQSWQDHDIYGNPFIVDANEDGQPDDLVAFDAAWQAGVIHELEEFRRLMPYAVLSCHSASIDVPGISATIDGRSIGFEPANVIEGERWPEEVLQDYLDWLTRPATPRATMMEGSPLDAIAYGYSFDPAVNCPTSTLEFARTNFAKMRFALALTLLGDGYYAYEYGDTLHGNDWWYDEFNHNLGFPVGPYRQTGPAGLNLCSNSGFEAGLTHWTFWANSAAGCTAAVDSVVHVGSNGASAARITIGSTSGTDWHISLGQLSRTVVSGTSYEVTFSAQSIPPRQITLDLSKQSPGWDDYGLDSHVLVGTNWQSCRSSFTCNATTNDARLQLFLGRTNGTVWIDDLELRALPPAIYQREYERGLAVLNATADRQTIDVGPGFARIVGDQAPEHDWILDDASAAFSVTGAWRVATNDTAEWFATPPFYHDWNGRSHQSTNPVSAKAQWHTPIDQTDGYTLQVWWSAAPSSPTWTTQAVYRILSDASTILVVTQNQQRGGDEWHTLGHVMLSSGSVATVELTASGTQTLVADAVRFYSDARFNDGSTSTVVTLESMDGIVLRRILSASPDNDADGIPDFQEWQYSGSVTGLEAAADLDGDGMVNLEEYLAGTNPTNGNSVLRITQVETSPLAGLCKIVWPVMDAYLYSVEVSTNLSEGFSPAVSNLTWSESQSAQWAESWSNNIGSRFYRIRVNPPE